VTPAVTTHLAAHPAAPRATAGQAAAEHSTITATPGPGATTEATAATALSTATAATTTAGRVPQGGPVDA
jgi:hypothetical protein